MENKREEKKRICVKIGKKSLLKKSEFMNWKHQYKLKIPAIFGHVILGFFGYKIQIFFFLFPHKIIPRRKLYLCISRATSNAL